MVHPWNLGQYQSPLYTMDKSRRDATLQKDMKVLSPEEGMVLLDGRTASDQNKVMIESRVELMAFYEKTSKVLEGVGVAVEMEGREGVER